MSTSEPNFQTATLEAGPRPPPSRRPAATSSALNWITPDGIAVKPLYTAADLKGLKYTDTLPGFEPYLRGPQATMYAVRPWTIRQYAGFSTAEESNAFYRKALAAGGQGVVGGLRPGHAPRLRQRPSARDRRRRQGRRGDRFGRGHEDPVRPDPARQGQRVDDDERRGAAGAGGLRGRGRRAGRGARPAAREPSRTTSSRSSWSATPTSFRPSPSMRIVGDIIEYTAQKMPKFNSISISGYHMQEAGANQALELAFTLADGMEYVKTAHGQGPGRRRLCRAAVVLLGHRHELLSGSGQDARRAPAVVPDHEGLRRRRTPRA